MNCHGCDGRGWVDSKVVGPTLCPVCNGGGQSKSIEPVVRNSVYDQDAIWTELNRDTTRGFKEALDYESRKIKNAKRRDDVIAHLLFNRDVTPHGNMIFYHLQHQTITGGKVPELSRDEITARNYCLDEDGKIRNLDGIPVSPAMWDFMESAKNNKRNIACTFDMNRKGNPFFCDINMLAFGIVANNGTGIGPFLSESEELLRTKHNVEIVNLCLCFLT